MQRAESWKWSCRTRRMVLRAFGVGVALLLVAADLAFADEWGRPKPEHWSANGEYVLKVAGGLRVADGLSLWRKTEQGLVEQWSRGYVDDRWPPHKAYVANDGQHVVLRDVHSQLGYGKCLVFLGPQGGVVRTYELREFLTDCEILHTRITISSQWWSEPGWFALRNGDRQFALVSSKGTVCCFDTATGVAIEVDEALKAQIVAEASADATRWLSDFEPGRRANGARMLGLLGAVDSVAALTTAFHDDRVTVQGILLRKPEPVYGVKLAAAEALVRLTGANAMPLIEPELDGANDYMRAELLNIISGAHPDEDEVPGLRRSPIPRETWERLARSKSEEVRSRALAKLLSGDDGTYVRGHPELLKSDLPGVRYAAVRALAEHATAEDLLRLREVLRDSDTCNELRVWRAIIRLNPADVRELLIWASKQTDRSLRFEAMLELARRGDASATKRVLARINALQEHTHERGGYCAAEFEAEDLCQLVAELKLREAEAGLRAASRNNCEDIRRPVCGALAALGDADALARLREFGRQGHALGRASAIKWLAVVDDKASLAYLYEATNDKEPWVREAATKAIAKLRADGE
jgi:HEAT repeat protein